MTTRETPVRGISGLEPGCLRRDERDSGGRVLLIVQRFHAGPGAGGAQMRYLALLHGLRALVATDVVSVAHVRDSVRHPGPCDPPVPDTVTTEDGVAPLPYRAEYCSEAARLLAGIAGSDEYAAVVFSDFQIHTYAAEVRAACRVPLVVDLHNAEAALYEAMVTHPAWPWAAHLSDRSGAWLPAVRHAERQLVQLADAVAVPSLEDRNALLRHGLDTPVTVVPNTVPVEETRRPSMPSRPQACVFIGALSYFPNAMAALDIVTVLAPALRAALPEMSVVLAGRNPPAFLLDAARDSPVRIVANPPEIRPLLADAVQIVPLTLGGGTRLKIIESFAYGTTVVSSAKGIEGIAARPGSHYLAAEGAADYVSAVGEVLRDPHEDLVRRQHAWDLAQQSYSWSYLPSRLRQLLATGGIQLR